MGARRNHQVRATAFTMSPSTHRPCQRHPELSRDRNTVSLTQHQRRGRLSAVSHPRAQLAMAAQDQVRADKAERWVTLSRVFSR
jgi:hypothetical protein